MKYNAADGKAEWLVDTEGISEEDLQAYVDNVYSILKGRYAAALSINNLDFYRFVWDNLLVPESEPETAEAVPIEAADEDINAGPMIYMTEETMPFYTTRAGRE